jgi:hypothetical protein
MTAPPPVVQFSEPRVLAATEEIAARLLKKTLNIVISAHNIWLHCLSAQNRCTMNSIYDWVPLPLQISLINCIYGLAAPNILSIHLVDSSTELTGNLQECAVEHLDGTLHC